MIGNTGIYKLSVKLSLFLLLLMVLPGANSVTESTARSITEGARKFRLDNGLTVILKEDHSAPVASIQVWIKAGSANETDKEAGITHIIEHMTFKGTPTRKKGEIGKVIESLGGDINAYTSFDRTVFFIEIASEHFEKAVDILLDAVQHSVIDPEELEKEREVILEEYRRSLDIPTRRLAWAMNELCYLKHPYRRPIIGSESTIRAITREDILNYMNKWYRADNMVLAAVGDFEMDDALEAVRKYTGEFPSRPYYSQDLPQEPTQTASRIKVINSDVQHVYADMSWHIPSATHPDIPALDILEIILGDGRSSRLYTRLKMKTNLVREIDATVYTRVHSGLFSIEAAMEAENVDAVVRAVAGEINRLRYELVHESELERARRASEADYLSIMETMKGQARTLAFFETMTGDMRNIEGYLESLRSVTASDIKRVANRYLNPDNLSIGLMVPKGVDNISLPQDMITRTFDLQSRDQEEESGTANRSKDQASSRVTLPNGMRVIIKENHRLPLVSIRAVMLGGTRLEPPDHSGISRFTARMLTRGTKNLSASEIASVVESWAGELYGFSGRNSIGLSARFLRGDLLKGLDLLADILLNPSFSEAEAEKVRDDILSDIRTKKESPVRQLTDLFNSTLYEIHPYGRSVTGTEESIRSITVSDIKKWYASVAAPSNLVISIVGDVSKDELMGTLKGLFKGFYPGTFSYGKITPEPPLTREKIIHLERPGKQIHIMIGYLGVDIKDRYNAPMAIIDTALSGKGGRLFVELRDKMSLAYSVSSFRRPGLETGMFAVYLACDPEKYQTARDAILRELERVRKDGLSLRELEDAKRYILGEEAIGYQTNGSQAMGIALDEIYGLGYDHRQTMLREVSEVTLEDIREAAKAILIPDRYVIVTVGPLSER